MTEMTDLTSDLLGSGIPFLDYKVYAERVFFPGHQESPLHRDLGVPESRRPTVEQGLGQLSNLLNSKLFLIKVPAPPPIWALQGWGGGPPTLQPHPFSVPPFLNLPSPPTHPLSLAPVHPHPGEPAHLLSSGPRLRGISAHRGTAREA